MPSANPWKSIQQKITVLRNTNFTLVVLVWKFINSHGTAQPTTNPPTQSDLPQSVTPSYALFFVAHSCHCLENPRNLFPLPLYFLQAGPLLRVHLPVDKESKRPKNFAFVRFHHEESIPYAIQMFRFEFNRSI